MRNVRDCIYCGCIENGRAIAGVWRGGGVVCVVVEYENVSSRCVLYVRGGYCWYGFIDSGTVSAM